MQNSRLRSVSNGSKTYSDGQLFKSIPLANITLYLFTHSCNLYLTRSISFKRNTVSIENSLFFPIYYS